MALVAVYLPLLFPDGRLPSRRWRLAAGLAAVATASMAVNFAIAPGPVDASEPDLPNPFSPDWAPAVLPILTRIATLLAVVSLVSGASASIVRFKRATDERERAQLKWFAYALGILVVALVAPLVVGFPHATEDTLLSGVLTCFGFAAIPIATGIAIVRYRLFDIDQLISRTLLYAALTGCVVGVYLFIVGYLGAVLRVGNDLVVSLVATAIVAVIFQPLRDHLQRAIARLLYGRRDEPYVVLSRLDRQLANSLAPDDVLSTIVTELRSALRLSNVAVMVRDVDGRTIVQAVDGVPVGETRELPVVFQRETVGALCVGARAAGETFTRRDLDLLQDVAQHAGAAVHAARLTAELRLSRERLVLAREEERRRLRRDLHDELAPTLAGLGLVAASVDRLIPRDPPKAQEAVRNLHAAIRQTTGDIRRMAHDLRPPALDELGLVGAIRDRVTNFTSSDAGPEIIVAVDGELPPLPAALEVAAYRIIHEALMNVIRHAQAHRTVVRLACVADALEVEVRDDGVGLQHAGRMPGIGLRSMRERAEELGGTCLIENLDGAGTRVHARIPFQTDA
ncbi:MAG: sensor histidine kinase [Chloroflexi bacterium]|nr:sensor histidine kinase [Chloroflexota bacterium]